MLRNLIGLTSPSFTSLRQTDSYHPATPTTFLNFLAGPQAAYYITTAPSTLTGGLLGWCRDDRTARFGETEREVHTRLYIKWPPRAQCGPVWVDCHVAPLFSLVGTHTLVSDARRLREHL